jgi:hypothetical protein
VHLSQYISSKFNISRRRVKSSLGLHKNGVSFCARIAQAVTARPSVHFSSQISGPGIRRNWEIWADGCAECVSLGLFLNIRFRACHTPHAKSRRAERERDGRTHFWPTCACVHMYTSAVCRKGSLRGNHYGVKALREKHRQKENIRRAHGGGSAAEKRE